MVIGNDGADRRRVRQGAEFAGAKAPGHEVPVYTTARLLRILERLNGLSVAILDRIR